MSKFWTFVKNAASGDKPENVELRIEGDIVDDDDIWIYEWLDMKATAPNAFRNELAQFKGQGLDMTVWIDSYGGSVYAAAGIYNALKEYDGKVTVKIDGKAMSAASVIAMAGDEILMSPLSIMMIHNPMTSAGGDASEMRKVASFLDTVKDAIINAYAIKTQRPRDEIAAMMDDETYMSANVAVKNGFADQVLYADSIPGGDPPIMNFDYSRLAVQNSANVAMKHLLTLASEGKIKTIRTDDGGVGDPPNKPLDDKFKNERIDDPVEPKNVDELRTAYPELVAQIEAAAKAEGVIEGTAAGTQAERSRIQAIDEVSATLDPALVVNAKYTTPQTVEQLAVAALKDNAAKGQKFLTDAAADAAASGSADVTAQAQALATAKEKEAQEEDAVAKNIADQANKKRGLK